MTDTLTHLRNELDAARGMLDRKRAWEHLFDECSVVLADDPTGRPTLDVVHDPCGEQVGRLPLPGTLSDALPDEHECSLRALINAGGEVSRQAEQAAIGLLDGSHEQDAEGAYLRALTEMVVDVTPGLTCDHKGAVAEHLWAEADTTGLIPVI